MRHLLSYIFHLTRFYCVALCSQALTTSEESAHLCILHTCTKPPGRHSILTQSIDRSPKHTCWPSLHPHTIHQSISNTQVSHSILTQSIHQSPNLICWPSLYPHTIHQLISQKNTYCRHFVLSCTGTLAAASGAFKLAGPDAPADVPTDSIDDEPSPASPSSSANIVSSTRTVNPAAPAREQPPEEPSSPAVCFSLYAAAAEYEAASSNRHSSCRSSRSGGGGGGNSSSSSSSSSRSSSSCSHGGCSSDDGSSSGVDGGAFGSCAHVHTAGSSAGEGGKTAAVRGTSTFDFPDFAAR